MTGSRATPNVLQKLKKYSEIHNEDSTEESEKNLFKAEREYVKFMKNLEDEYDKARSIGEKNKINKQILELTDRRILIFG